MRGWRLFAVPQPGDVANISPNKAAHLASIMRANLGLLERAYDPATEEHERRDHTIAELEAELNALLAEFAQMTLNVDCLLDYIAELEAQGKTNKK